MRNVLDCINAFIPLLSTEYELVLGRKGVSVTLRISFDKKDCFHLMGLQYLVDRPELSRDRGRVFDEIADGTITIEKIESSDFYNKIEQRVHFLPLLEQMIDSNDTVFKYNKKANMYSMIEADYLMENNVESRNLFCFYLMMKEIIISVVHFFQRKRWIIQKIKHRGHFFIRKRLIYQPE